MVMFFILLNPFPFDSIINEYTYWGPKLLWYNQESNLASHTCNTLSLPLGHLDHTYFNSFPILLNSFSPRVELMNNNAQH